MDSWSPIDAAFSTLGFDPTGVRTHTPGLGGDPTGVRSASPSGFSGDPTGVSEWTYGFEGVDPLMDIGLPAFTASLQPEQNPWMPNQGGTPNSLGGEFAILDKYNSAFQQASARYGLDPNWVKSVAARERGWEGTSIAGAQGIMQIMPGGYPELEAQYPNWRTDPTQNIMLGAAILADKIRVNGGNRDLGTMRYLGVGSDAYGTTTDAYLRDIQGYYAQLQKNGGSFGGGNPVGGGNLSMMFGQYANVPDWGEFGVGSSNGFYDYGTQYGLNGVQHTGVDIPMPVGTAYRAPASGVVTCSGTGVGPGANGQGCAAFRDVIGGGVGRVEVQLDNGVILIYGHSNAAALRPGQRFNAGAVLGWSGGEVSPHVHLEARVIDPSMPSGYRIVDPRSVLGGGSTGTWATGTSGQAQPTGDWNSIINYFLTTPGAHW